MASTSHRPPVAPLKVPARPSTTSRSVSFSHSVFSPLPQTPSFLSPSATPKPRPSETAAWFFVFVFHTLPLYVAHSWFSSHPSTSSPSITIVFTFLVLLTSSATFALLQEKQARTLRSSSITSRQWGLLFGNGLLVAFSVFLKLDGVRSCGPLAAIMAEYAGSVLARLVFMESSKSSNGNVRGILVTVLGLVLVSQSWTVESCSPLAIRHRLRMFSRTLSSSGGEGTTLEGTGDMQVGGCGSLPVWAPILAGFLNTVVKLASTRTSLRSIPKKRVQGLSSVCATLLMLPLALFQMDNLFVAPRSGLWPLAGMIVLGLARSIMGDFYFEDRLLIPPGSSRHLFITLCCSCFLELLFGVDISPLGFLVCAALICLGVRELLGTNSAFSWDSIVEHETSDSFIRGPLRHIATDYKSRKIACFLAMNAAFMVVEFISGFMSNSLGMVSDACHMLFDCAALAIGLYAAYISKLQPNAVFAYGYGRFEVLSGYANAVFLVLVGSLIVLESIERILDPPEISTEKLLLVSVGGLLVNVVGLVFFHDEHHHAHHHHHHEEHGHQHAHHGEKSHLELKLTNHHGDQLQNSHQHSHDSHQHCSGNDHHHHHHLEHSHSDHKLCSGHEHDHSHSGDHQHHTDSHDHHHQHSTCEDHLLHGHVEANHFNEDDHKHHHGDCHHDHHHHSDSHHHQHSDSHHHQHNDSHHHHEHSDHEDSHHDHIDHNMQGIFLHILADTLGSVGVVISTILIKYKGWMLTDPACSIFISGMIIASVIPLLKNSGEILLQRTPRSTDKRLHEALQKLRYIEGVAGFERLHVWSFTNTEVVGTLQLHVQSSADKTQVRERVSELLTKVGITDLTVQVEEI